jgi:hypothetical protein
MKKYDYRKATTTEYLELTNAALRHSNFYAQHTGNHHWTNRMFCKRDALVKMDCDYDDFLDSPQVQGNVLIMRNTLEIQEAMNEWLTWCCDPDYLICFEERDLGLRDEFPERSLSFMKEEYPEYYVHRHDQAILSNTIFRRKLVLCDGDRTIGWSEENKKVICRIRDDNKNMLKFTRGFKSKNENLTMTLYTKDVNYNSHIDLANRLRLRYKSRQYNDPVIFHTFWKGNLSEKHYMSVKSCYVTNVKNRSKRQIYVWVEDCTINDWYKKIEEIAKIIQYDNANEIKNTIFDQKYHIGNGIPFYVDMVRSLLLYKYGGCWFDLDVLFITAFDPLFLEFHDNVCVFQWEHQSYPNNAVYFSLHAKHVDMVHNIKYIIKRNRGWGFQEAELVYSLPLKFTVLPCAWIDPSWIENPLSIRFETVFDASERKISAKEFFPGIFAYHWHNQWNKTIDDTCILKQVFESL